MTEPRTPTRAQTGEAARPPVAQRVPILMYHQIARDVPATFRTYSVAQASFAGQMRWLARAGYTVIALDHLLAARSGRASLPRKPVVITFDDGYVDCVRHATPVLRDHGFTAIFYLVAGLAGRPSEWLRSELGYDFPLIGWDTARAIEKEGFACGSHSMTHPHLAQLESEQSLAELTTSRRILEQELGHEVRHLAYPFGSYDARVQRLAAQTGYVSACSTNPGLSRPEEDPLALNRVEITGHDSLFDFRLRVRTGFALRDYVRRMLRRLGLQGFPHHPRS